MVLLVDVVAIHHTKSMKTSPIDLLQRLGLNHLEAEVYALLLGCGEPTTAYGIGKALGKPTANVYKAIEALARKGAVIVEEGEPRLCRPIPADEFISQLKAEFLDTADRASLGLSDLGEPAPDEGVYRLESVSLILERCRLMLQRAERIAVVDAFPQALQAVRPDLAAAASRGVELYVQAYKPTRIRGAHVVETRQSAEILEHWRSQQLNCVIDGREALLALLHDGLSGVHQAIWTGSLFLSGVMLAGFLREHVFHQIAAVDRRGGLPASLRKLFRDHPGFHTTDIPGHRLLFSQLGLRGGLGK